MSKTFPLTDREPLVAKSAILAALTQLVAGLVAVALVLGIEVDPGLTAAIVGTADVAITAGLALVALWGRSDAVLPGTVAPATLTSAKLNATDVLKNQQKAWARAYGRLSDELEELSRTPTVDPETIIGSGQVNGVPVIFHADGSATVVSSDQE